MARNQQYPNLAGQKAVYLISALSSYKTGQRKGGQSAVMYGTVASLTEKNIEYL
ncbi:hypothetical protein [Colwellia sp. M166]|uniref:c-type cytochrome n=1 Tax=Colwellia sp. M166 TaxID=2583805 RepID=UPI00211EC711|nr:hypothetical protein [Colwellia sp. M166]|tara:strand:+ start:2505 stop:2666 length:162 start_codon:yes stop_codon:yes gene_type:complete